MKSRNHQHVVGERTVDVNPDRRVGNDGAFHNHVLSVTSDHNAPIVLDGISTKDNVVVDGPLKACRRWCRARSFVAMRIRHARLRILVRAKHAHGVRLDRLRVRVRVGRVPIPKMVALFDRVVKELDPEVGGVDGRTVATAPRYQVLGPGKLVL